jgi:outer membrane protein TolC
MPTPRRRGAIAGFPTGGLLVLLAFGAPAADDPVGPQRPPLPNPLTLEQALSLADEPHPELLAVRAERQAARADLLLAESVTGTYATAVGKLRAVDPSFRSVNPDNNDSQATLFLRKRLYDFGLTDSRREAAQQRLAGAEAEQLDVRQRRHLEIMQRYFDVLLADLAYARENEAMATAFVAVDKARDRHELGQVSDVDLLELESLYQDARSDRTAALNEQRVSRARLANALNRPGELPADLRMPPAPDWPEQLPEFDALWTKVQVRNPLLDARRARVRAAEQALRAAQAGDNPTLSGEAEAGVYNRPTASTHPLAVGLVLEVPLYRGGETRARIAAARAELSRRQAELADSEQQLRQEVLELWLELGRLQVRREQVDTEDEFRELYLDRSRALYDLEVQTDLGDAMVQTSVVRYRQAEVQLQWQLAQARLRALGGELIDGGSVEVEADGSAAPPVEEGIE